LICAPKAIIGVLDRLIDQPITLAVRYTLTGNAISNVRVGEAWRHDHGTDREWLVHVAPNIRRELRVVRGCINTGIYIHARSVRQRGF
jgi:hypothetical protein